MAEYLMMDAVTAAMLLGATAGDDDRLEPRAAAGGMFALPVSVREDPAFAWLRDVLGELSVAVIEPGDWPG